MSEEDLAEKEKCRIAFDVALAHIMDICGVGGKTEVFKVAGSLIGLSEEESNDVSEKCDIVLKQKITKDLCYDFRKIRQYVLCLAWDIMEKRKVRFADAIREAWREAKSKCAEVSAVI